MAMATSMATWMGRGDEHGNGDGDGDGKSQQREKEDPNKYHVRCHRGFIKHQTSGWYV